MEIKWHRNNLRRLRGLPFSIEASHEITLLTLMDHFDTIKDGLEAKDVLTRPAKDVGEDIKLALALDIVIKYFGGETE